jgi:hypothetical protein
MTVKITPRLRVGSERGGSTLSIEEARRRLGGRVTTTSTASSRRAPGSPVQAVLRDGKKHFGVVLSCSEQHCDVWFDDGTARRVRADLVASSAAPAPDSLTCVAAEVRLFAAFVEGDRIRWERSGGRLPPVEEGCIVEKCRYGAIVVTRSGKLVAVGFRRLWPAVVRGVA